MSGFLPSNLASWALRGQRNDEEETQGNTVADTSNEAPLSAAEMRAQRLAKMEEAQRRAQEQQQEKNEPEPMDVDGSPAASKSKPPPPKPAAAPSPPPAAIPPLSPPEQPEKKHKSKDTSSSSTTPSDSAKKNQRKKEMMLKKVASIVLQGSSLAASVDSSITVVNVDSMDISAQSIADILSTKVSVHPDTSTMSTQKPLIAYLATTHRKAGDEIKTLESSKSKNSDLCEILTEIERQVVSYAATCLIAPDLFNAGRDATAQLANCLLTSMTDVNTSITFGASGAKSSFYYQLVEELSQQDPDALDRVVSEIADIFFAKVSRCESVLDNLDGAEGMIIASAFSALCSHKKAAEALTKHEKFLLPREGTPQASEMIRPALPTQAGNFFQLLAGGQNAYKKRSGKALELQTIIGIVLRLGAPKTNQAFSPQSILTQSQDSVERTTSQQRSHLHLHQEACTQFIKAMLKGGSVAVSNVMQWFTDAMLVNTGASAMRPDPSKVSSTNLLLNLSVVLLKLCEPFVDDEKKMKLIDPGFVSSAADNGGIFPLSGDDMVARLGERAEDSMTDSYNPKNTFIPQTFFLCSRSLHYGMCPALSYHENLLRHIGHMHWEIRNSGGDIRSNPQFGVLIARERSAEVGLFEPDMVKDTCRFCNFLARVLFEMEEDVLRTMPEDFVTDLCAIIVSIAKLKPKLLAGIDLRYVFKLCVKLLSAQYAHVSKSTTTVFRIRHFRRPNRSNSLSTDGSKLQPSSDDGRRLA